MGEAKKKKKKKKKKKETTVEEKVPRLLRLSCSGQGSFDVI